MGVVRTKEGSVINGWKVVGGPLTDHKGRTIVPVSCQDCGYARYKTREYISQISRCEGCDRIASPRSYTRLSHKAMIGRCHNPSNKDYPSYGGRGITVCDRWRGKGGLGNFIEDMGHRPKGLTIGRTDNDGHYCPENCKWETHSQQQTNKGSNRYITYKGKTMCVASWNDELGFPEDTIGSRLFNNWDEIRALEQPLRKKKPNPNSMTQRAKAAGISYRTVKSRVKRG